MKIKTRSIELTGSNYEIGTTLGKMTASVKPLRELHTAGFKGFDNAEVKKAAALFSRWCPGLNEELQGFADALQVPLAQIFYYGMTYLRPNCSQIALLPSMTKSGRPLLARNYEFSHEAEDFTLVKTSVTGKYTHLGTSVLHFGRDDGFNEYGLAVTMSSCGFPVGPLAYMRKPKLVGLQFWAVIRALLENCKDVNEALDFVTGMPIAYNLNLMLMDKVGNIALVETMDGHRAVKQISHGKREQYICATNHPVLPELIPYEPSAMRHSLQRYEWIRQRFDGASDVTSEDLKEMLLSKYPNGLCCHFFNEFFGTTKSMVIDPVCGTIELCWGGRRENGWHKYSIQEPLTFSEKEIEISFDRFSPEMGEYVPLDLPVKP
jgi:predicted choloylglycine hydrolase